jgi:hypothetical protein
VKASREGHSAGEALPTGRQAPHSGQPMRRARPGGRRVPGSGALPEVPLQACYERIVALEDSLAAS